jgi:ABC-type transport system substrate-binding protein
MGLQSHFQWFTPIRRKLNIQPDIAKSWTISPDAKTYTFTEGHLFSKAHFIW